MDYDAAVEVFFAPPPPDMPTPDVVAAATPARRLRDALEPIAMHAVWSRAVNAALAEHGLNFLTSYVCGRAAALGAVPSSVVAATFAAFEPGLIDQLWTEGRSHIELDELIAVRDRAAAASLRHALGAVVGESDVTRAAQLLEGAVSGADATGRVLFAALRSQPQLDDPYGRLWRAADLFREHRGDSHVAAYVAAGLDPVRMGVLSETWVGYPVGEYSGTRAWPPPVHAAAVARLEADGLLIDGVLTDRGRSFRNGIEAATDTAQDELVGALGGRLDVLAEELDGWSKLCVEAGAFPPDLRKRAAG
ncbi:MAG TPA: hypothetical protein VGE11_01900 [Pseudonocardia sp.]